MKYIIASFCIALHGQVVFSSSNDIVLFPKKYADIEKEMKEGQEVMCDWLPTSRTRTMVTINDMRLETPFVAHYKGDEGRELWFFIDDPVDNRCVPFMDALLKKEVFSSSLLQCYILNMKMCESNLYRGRISYHDIMNKVVEKDCCYDYAIDRVYRYFSVRNQCVNGVFENAPEELQAYKDAALSEEELSLLYKARGASSSALKNYLNVHVEREVYMIDEQNAEEKNIAEKQQYVYDLKLISALDSLMQNPNKKVLAVFAAKHWLTICDILAQKYKDNRIIKSDEYTDWSAWITSFFMPYKK